MVGLELAGQPTRDELDQHGMQPAHGPGARGGHVPEPSNQQPQHDPIVVGDNLAQVAVSEPGDRRRQRVIRVALACLLRTQQPNPGGQGRRHIDDVFAFGDELLGQQLAESVSRLDRPRPLIEGRSPRQQPLRLTAVGHDLQLAESLFVLVDRHRSVSRLVRVDPDDHRHHFISLVVNQMWCHDGHS